MKIFKILIFLLFVNLFLSAQMIDTKLNVIQDTDSIYVISVSLKTSDNDIYLGNACYRIEYNGNELSFPELPIDKIDYSFNNNLALDYFASVTSPKAEVISINIFNSSKSIHLSNSFQEIVKIRFRKKEVRDKYNFKFVTTEVFQPNSSEPLSCKILEDSDS